MTGRSKIVAPLLLAALLLVSAPARADIIQTIAFGPGVPNFVASLVFNKFTGDPTSLISIIVDLGITTQGGLGQVDNESANPATVWVEFGSSAYIFSPQVGLPSNLTQPWNQVNASVGQNFVLGADDGDGAGVQKSGADYGELPGATVSSSATGNVLSTSFSQYTGTGTFSIFALASTYLSVSGAGGISQGTTPPLASGSVTVTYKTKTTPPPPGGGVPEPGTLLLMGSAAMGMFGYRIRRRRKKN